MLVAQADWAIVERGWHAHVLGEAPHTFTSAVEAVKTLRVRRRGLLSAAHDGVGPLPHMMVWTTEALGLMYDALMHPGLVLTHTLLQPPRSCSHANSVYAGLTLKAVRP